VLCIRVACRGLCDGYESGMSRADDEKFMRPRCVKR